MSGREENKKEKGKREECAKKREKLPQEDTNIGIGDGSTNFVVLQKTLKGREDMLGSQSWLKVVD